MESAPSPVMAARKEWVRAADLIPMAPNIANYVQHYDPTRAHHRAFLHAALTRLIELDPEALSEGGELRDVWVAAVETKPPSPTPNPPGASYNLEPGLRLIREFEGCRLRAYLCPAKKWTIGWGNTTYPDGRAVKEGDLITQSQADQMLLDMVNRQVLPVLSKTIPYWTSMNEKQKGALLSFAWNLGWRFFGAEGFNTISARLRDKEWHRVPDDLLLYRNPGSSFEAGLKRRREAEGRLWMEGLVGQSPQQGKPNPLPVPWYSQLDSETDQAKRMCFSSSCAMLLAFLRPGILKGPNGDDQYLTRVQKYGDTTSAIAQINALRSYEIEADFIKNADFALIKKQIDQGVPVPCGYLHRGPVHSPIGGGHWLIVVGYTRTHVLVHDPLGEADLIGGSTINRPARFCQYSKENFGRRWMVRDLGGGKYRYEPGLGWAVVVRR